MVTKLIASHKDLKSVTFRLTRGAYAIQSTFTLSSYQSCMIFCIEKLLLDLFAKECLVKRVFRQSMPSRS